MADVEIRPLREIVEAHREEIKAIVARPPASLRERLRDEVLAAAVPL